MSDNTNYKLNNIDLGKCLVTRDYFNRVYSSINTSYKRNVLWAWGDIPAALMPGSVATVAIDPFMVVPSSICDFYSPEWKDFHISSTGAGQTNVRLLDTQGKMFLWGFTLGRGVSWPGAGGGTTQFRRPSAMCTTNIIESCVTYNNILKLGKDHSACHVSYIRTDYTNRVWGCAASGNLGTFCTIGTIFVEGATVGYQWPPVSTYSTNTSIYNISLQMCRCNGIYNSHQDAGGYIYYWGDNNVFTRVSAPVSLGAPCGSGIKNLCNNGATLGALLCSTDVLVMMGYNNKGQLGNSTTINNICYTAASFANTNPSLSVKSFSIGQCSSFAVASNGTLWAWGDNTYGQLGTNRTVGTSCPIQSIDKNNDWKYVTTNRVGTAVAAIKNDGSLWVWGDVSNVQGSGTGGCVIRSSPVQVGTRKNWVKVAIENDYYSAAGSPFMLGITEEDL